MMTIALAAVFFCLGAFGAALNAYLLRRTVGGLARGERKAGPLIGGFAARVGVALAVIAIPAATGGVLALLLCLLGYGLAMAAVAMRARGKA